MTDKAQPKRAPSDQLTPGQVPIASLGFGLLLAYFALVLLPGETVFGVTIRVAHTFVLIAGASLGVHLLLTVLQGRGRLGRERILGFALLSFALVGSLLFLDVAYGMVENLRLRRDAPSDPLQFYYRVTDPTAWHFEPFPPQYYPTERNFQIFKPNTSVSAQVYGHTYYQGLAGSLDDVLELREVQFSIDANGFRETGALEAAAWFALGDSFTLGVGITQAKSWVERAEQMLESPIYNLGTAPSSPAQQRMLLEYVARRYPTALRGRNVLWMIFEGNDLDESYAVARPIEPEVVDLLGGTLLADLRELAFNFRAQSMIDRYRQGRLLFRNPAAAGDADPHQVDGGRILYPLYHSDTFGPRIFQQHYIDRARLSLPEFLEHPHLPLFDAALDGMAALSREHGFAVTVLLAPSAVRLYARHFRGLPEISPRPYFLDHVAERSRSLGFDTIDLAAALQPHADEELIYWRDDSHWNERGNELVAGILSERLRQP